MMKIVVTTMGDWFARAFPFRAQSFPLVFFSFIRCLQKQAPPAIPNREADRRYSQTPPPRGCRFYEREASPFEPLCNDVPPRPHEEKDDPPLYAARPAPRRPPHITVPKRPPHGVLEAVTAVDPTESVEC